MNFVPGLERSARPFADRSTPAALQKELRR
jgi:hypothetical protein